MLKNGIIALADGGRIAPGTTRAAFLGTRDGQRATSVVNNRSWTSYVLRSVRIERQVFALVLTFEGEALRTVALAREKESASWDSQSKDALAAEKEENDRWLRDTAGIEAGTVTSWGKLESVVDFKTGAAEIIMTFSGSQPG